MTRRAQWLRFLGGLAGVLVIVLVIFALLIPWINHYGATPAELARSYYGDEMLPNPAVVWTNAITIHARPEQVWPWVAQMGDTRAAFYSYTFIEKLFGGGEDLYNNADRIHPEWQDPQPGQSFVSPMVAIHTVKTGQFIFGASALPELGWNWLWELSPQGVEDTRLIVHMVIQMPPGTPAPGLIGGVVSITGFVMEKGMLDGLKARAEGRIPWAGDQAAGIILWLIAVGIGIAVARLFIVRRDWRSPLSAGLAVIAVLFIFTYLQPAIWVRAVYDLILLVGLVGLYRRKTFLPKP